MRLSALLLLAVVSTLGASVASEPGHPLDCGDWEFNDPGLGCEMEVPYPCSALEESKIACEVSNDFRAMDNEGGLLRARAVNTPDTCMHYGRYIKRLEIVRTQGTTTTIVASLTDRCHAPVGWDFFRTTEPEDIFRMSLNELSLGHARILFDRVNGRLLISLEPACGGPCDEYPPAEIGSKMVHAITGFTTLYEIQQSYAPDISELGFRTPVMPEGMPGADWFNTYWGDLASVGDWASAQPLRCEYPATIPSVGDYLTVADTLPTPEPGKGYYYVTAAIYAGETRYGRRASGGVLTGRDSAVLPVCE